MSFLGVQILLINVRFMDKFKIIIKSVSEPGDARGDAVFLIGQNQKPPLLEPKPAKTRPKIFYQKPPQF